MRKFALTLAALGAFAVATPALAYDSNQLNVPKDKWMSTSDLKTKLQDQGYTVQEIETDDGAYEVDMTDKDGTRIEAHVHPETGEILKGYDD